MRIGKVNSKVEANIAADQDLWDYDFMHSSCKSVQAILAYLSDNNKSEMARKSHLPQPTISRICNEKVVPSLDVLDAIARAYGLETWQLLVPGFDPKHPPALRYMNGAEEALYRKFKELRADLHNLDG